MDIYHESKYFFSSVSGCNRREIKWNHSLFPCIFILIVKGTGIGDRVNLDFYCKSSAFKNAFVINE